MMLEIDTLERLIPKIMRFATASKAMIMLKSSKVSLLACYNRAMWSTYVDPYNVFEKIGPELEFLSVAELCREIEHISDDEVATTVSEFKDKYRVMDNVDEEKFKASVRATLAMERLAQSVGTDLLVLNDIDKVLFEFVGLRPGFTPTKPDLELISVPEGDIGGGLAVYFLSLLSGRIGTFIEPFYIDEQNGGFVAGHAGPNNYTERPENMIIARDERFAKSKWKYAGAPFAWYVFPEGEKTMLHVSEENGKLKLVATLVECLPTKHYLASYSHANFRHKTLPPCELFKRIGECGVNQHFGIVSGNLIEELKVFASLMGFDLYVIE
jgi:L-arabinose isomerase